MASSGLGIYGPAAIIVGWYVVHRLAIARERDKFRREAIAREVMDLCASTSDLLSKSITYHCSDRDAVHERALAALFDRLALRIQHLPTRDGPIGNSAAVSAAIIFKQAATGIHFADEHEGPLAPADEIVANIQLAAYSLEQGLLQIRSTTFAK